MAAAEFLSAVVLGTSLNETYFRSKLVVEQPILNGLRSAKRAVRPPTPGAPLPLRQRVDGRRPVLPEVWWTMDAR